MAKKRLSLYENYKKRYLADKAAKAPMLSETMFNIQVDIIKKSLSSKDLELFKKNPARAIVMSQREVSNRQVAVLQKVAKKNKIKVSSSEIKMKGENYFKEVIASIEVLTGHTYSEEIDSP